MAATARSPDFHAVAGRDHARAEHRLTQWEGEIRKCRVPHEPLTARSFETADMEAWPPSLAVARA